MWDFFVIQSFHRFNLKGFKATHSLHRCKIMVQERKNRKIADFCIGGKARKLLFRKFYGSIDDRRRSNRFIFSESRPPLVNGKNGESERFPFFV
jgi:hypothetical protein